jgi:hypothetical protein
VSAVKEALVTWTWGTTMRYVHATDAASAER